MNNLIFHLIAMHSVFYIFCLFYDRFFYNTQDTFLLIDVKFLVGIN